MFTLFRAKLEQLLTLGGTRGVTEHGLIHGVETEWLPMFAVLPVSPRLKKCPSSGLADRETLEVPPPPSANVQTGVIRTPPTPAVPAAPVYSSCPGGGGGGGRAVGAALPKPRLLPQIRPYSCDARASAAVLKPVRRRTCVPTLGPAAAAAAAAPHRRRRRSRAVIYALRHPLARDKSDPATLLVRSDNGKTTGAAAAAAAHPNHDVSSRLTHPRRREGRLGGELILARAPSEELVRSRSGNRDGHRGEGIHHRALLVQHQSETVRHRVTVREKA